MGEFINKEFEDYQKRLEIHSMHLKEVVEFEHEQFDDIIKDINNKVITYERN